MQQIGNYFLTYKLDCRFSRIDVVDFSTPFFCAVLNVIHVFRDSSWSILKAIFSLLNVQKVLEGMETIN